MLVSGRAHDANARAVLQLQFTDHDPLPPDRGSQQCREHQLETTRFGKEPRQGLCAAALFHKAPLDQIRRPHKHPVPPRQALVRPQGLEILAEYSFC